MPIQTSLQVRREGRWMDGVRGGGREGVREVDMEVFGREREGELERVGDSGDSGGGEDEDGYGRRMGGREGKGMGVDLSTIE